MYCHTQSEEKAISYALANIKSYPENRILFVQYIAYPPNEIEGTFLLQERSGIQWRVLVRTPIVSKKSYCAFEYEKAKTGFRLLTSTTKRIPE